jgi:O-antigen ligase
MSTALATLLCAVGILGLFYLDRDTSVHTSKALWIPVIWFWLNASRPVSVWLGWAPSTPTVGQQIDGSPTDRLIYMILLAIGLAVLARRGRRAFSLLATNWPIVLYFSYCLLSVAWSDFPGVAVRRWFKATGDVVMILIIVTDAQPIAALRRLFSRLGFVLLPVSVLLIKYYPTVGRTYDSWTGEPSNTGVSTNKNILGVITFILALGTLWQVLRLWRNSGPHNRFRQLVAQCTLLGCAVWLLFNAHSATSGVCFTLGAGLMLATGLRQIRGRPYAVHALVLSFLLLAGLIALTGAEAAVLQALGRNPGLTGRASEIWPTVIPMNPNPLVGAGFESFWLGPRLQYLWDKFPHLYLNEAHNGFLEVYLNLGLIGVGLIALLLIDGYRRSVAAFRADPSSSSLMLAYILTAPVYSMTEAGFRMLDLSWSFLLLAIIGSSQIPKLVGESAQFDSTPSESVRRPPAGARTTSIMVNR